MKLVSTVKKVSDKIGGLTLLKSIFKLPGLPGPQIDDIPVQQARDGVPINKPFGITPCVGNVIAQTPPITVKKKKKKGKGAPKVTEQSVLRTYAIGVCKGPIHKFLEVWENEKLVADFTEANSLPEDTAAFAAQATFYLGTPDQMPDPELEAIFGVGNVPAHRNLAYVVIARRDVSANSGQIPQYRFLVQRPDPNEVLETDLLLDWDAYSFPVPFQQANSGQTRHSVGNGIAMFPTFNGFNEELPLGSGVNIVDVATGVSTWVSRTEASGGWNGAFFDGTRHVLYATVFGIPVFSLSSDGLVWELLDTSLFDPTETNLNAVSSTHFAKIGALYFALSNTFQPPRVYSSPNLLDWVFVSEFPVNHTGPISVVEFNGRAVIASATEDSTANTLISTDLTLTDWVSYQNPIQELAIPGSVITLAYSILDNLLIALGPTTDPPEGWKLAVAVSATGLAGSWTVLGFANLPNTAEDPAITWPIVSDGKLVGVQFTGGFPDQALISDGLGIVETFTALGRDTIADVIKWTAGSVGIPTDRLKVDNMQDVVNGLTLGGTYNGAEVIRALQVAGLFDLVQIDGKLTSVKRGGAAVATILHDDMVGEGGDSARRIVRQQRVELTKKLHLEYADIEQDYATTTEPSERRSIDVTTTGEKTIQTPLALHSSEAATLVDKLHRIDWVESAGPATITVPLQFLKLTPSDIVFVETEPSRLRRMRVSKTTMIDGKIGLTLDFDRQSIFSAQVQGTPRLLPPPPVTSIPAATVFEVMDLPALREQDDQFGVYIAARGDGAWQGAELQVSADAGMSWGLVADITTASVIGILRSEIGTVHPEWADLTNTIVIDIAEEDIDEVEAVDTFSLLRGGNALHVNGEIIQYRDVVQSGPAQFTLSYLIRGRLDTTIANHAIGSKVTLLQEPQFVPLTQSLFGIPLQFRAPAYGTVEANAAVIPMSLTGNSVREWLPTSVVAVKSGSDYNITWRNRYRLGTELNPSPSPRMVGHRVIADNGTESRSRDVAIPINTLVYTSQMVVADFGLPQSSLTFTVIPISALTEIVTPVVTPPEVAVPRGPVTQFDFADGGFEAAGAGWVLGAGSPGSLTPTTNPANARTGAGYGQFTRAAGAMPPAFILGVQNAIVERGTSVSVSGFARVLQTLNGGNVSAAVWIRLHKPDGSDYVTLIGPFTNFLGASADYKEVRTSIPVPVPVPTTGEDVLLDAGIVVQSAVSDINMQIDDFVLTAFVLT